MLLYSTFLILYVVTTYFTLTCLSAFTQWMKYGLLLFSTLYIHIQEMFCKKESNSSQQMFAHTFEVFVLCVLMLLWVLVFWYCMYLYCVFYSLHGLPRPVSLQWEHTQTLISHACRVWLSRRTMKQNVHAIHMHIMHISHNYVEHSHLSINLH